MWIGGDAQQGVAYVMGQDLPARGGAALRGIENALADQAAIGSTQASVFPGFAARDHQARSDFQLAEHIALILTTANRLIVQLVDRQTRHLIRLFDQTSSIGKGCEAHGGAGF
ncbi:hypothetical protein D9M71_330750 [compost metagenome]